MYILLHTYTYNTHTYTYIHVHTYIYTYIHTYVHTYMYSISQKSLHAYPQVLGRVHAIPWSIVCAHVHVHAYTGDYIVYTVLVR